MKGTVFNIQRFSVNDGPGVRTTVFLKGCPLRCAWCHNPEGLSPRPQLYFEAQKCVGCSACVQACAEGCHEMRDGRHGLNLEKCRGCGACAEACAFGALSLYGQAMDAESVMKTVLRDLPFYEDKGGLTISGGEPLMQAQFSCELLDLARAAGIHCCVESSGYGGREAAQSVFERADLVLIDCKHTEAESLFHWTGARLERIEAAYGLLLELHKPAVLRVSTTPGRILRALPELSRNTPIFRRWRLWPIIPWGRASAPLWAWIWARRFPPPPRSRARNGWPASPG